jgi:hypothetical protein
VSVDVSGSCDLRQPAAHENDGFEHRKRAIETGVIAQVLDDPAAMRRRGSVAPEQPAGFPQRQAASGMREIDRDLARKDDARRAAVWSAQMRGLDVKDIGDDRADLEIERQEARSRPAVLRQATLLCLAAMTARRALLRTALRTAPGNLAAHRASHSFAPPA